MVKYSLGQTFVNTQGDTATFIEKLDGKYSLFKFSDGTVIKGSLTNANKGYLKNPNLKTVHGVACIGQGLYNSGHKSYNIWVAMLGRCYADTPSSRYYKTYKGCTVHPDWFNFQIFARDYDELSKECTVESPQLDKDLLSDTKVYSKDTCCFLPHAINTALQDRKGISLERRTGKIKIQMSIHGKNTYIGQCNTEDEAKVLYAKTKSSYLIELAESYKNNLSTRIYNAIILKAKGLINEVA